MKTKKEEEKKTMNVKDFTLENGVIYLLGKALWGRGINLDENSHIRLPRNTEIVIVGSVNIDDIKIKAYPKTDSSVQIEMTAKKDSVIKSILGKEGSPTVLR